MMQEFDSNILQQFADAARHKQQLLRELEPKPWRRAQAQMDAFDALGQFASYCDIIIAMGNGEK